MSVSEHLIYQIIQNNSCFNKTSRLWGGTRFSKEKSNVLNLNKFKYSGLARKNSLGVFLTNKGEIAVRKADSKNEQNPRKRTRVTKIKKLGYNKRATFVVQVIHNNHCFEVLIQKCSKQLDLHIDQNYCSQQ